MNSLNRTGFESNSQGIWISKDPLAKLTYSLDWSEWLPTGDSLATVLYTLQVRVNDPAPLTLFSSGIQGKLTYAQLGGGQLGKTYIVTAKITTVDGLIDRRNFRVVIENRSA
jgi:hypothetical protein